MSFNILYSQNIDNDMIVLLKNKYNIINKLKNQIDNVEYKKWRLIRTLITKYEMIGNNKIHNIRQLKN